MDAGRTGLEGFLERAKALHRGTPLIDGHNDLPWQYRLRAQRAISRIDIGGRQDEMGLHTDIPRSEGGWRRGTVLVGVHGYGSVGRRGGAGDDGADRRGV